MTGFSPSDFLSVGFSIYPGQQLGLRRNERRAIVLKFSPASLCRPCILLDETRTPPVLIRRFNIKTILLVPIPALYDRAEPSDDAVLAPNGPP